MADDTWLEPSTVKAVLGSGVSEALDDDQVAAILPGIRDYVESRRKDLFVTVDAEDPDDPPVTTFEATPQVKLGAAMLAYRIVNRPGTPLGVVGSSDDGYTGIVRDDPDIARFLGIGSSSKFVFGATPRVEAV